MKFRISNNTDSVDIDQKCLGLRVSLDNDNTNLMYDNRGLHIQIRHNRDKNTFEAANQLTKLLTAAPEMLEVLRLAYAALTQVGCASGHEHVIDAISGAIVKATKV